MRKVKEAAASISFILSVLTYDLKIKFAKKVVENKVFYGNEGSEPISMLTTLSSSSSVLLP